MNLYYSVSRITKTCDILCEKSERAHDIGERNRVGILFKTEYIAQITLCDTILFIIDVLILYPKIVLCFHVYLFLRLTSTFLIRIFLLVLTSTLGEPHAAQALQLPVVHTSPFLTCHVSLDLEESWLPDRVLRTILAFHHYKRRLQVSLKVLCVRERYVGYM